MAFRNADLTGKNRFAGQLSIPRPDFMGAYRRPNRPYFFSREKVSKKSFLLVIRLDNHFELPPGSKNYYAIDRISLS